MICTSIVYIQTLMSSEALKKRKSKVLRSEGGTADMKRTRGEVDQQVKTSQPVLCGEERILKKKIRMLIAAFLTTCR